MLNLWSISCVIARSQQHFWMIARHSGHHTSATQLRRGQLRPAGATAMFGQAESCGHRSSKWPLQGEVWDATECHIPEKSFKVETWVIVVLLFAGGP